MLVEVHWLDAQGRKVPLDEPAAAGYLVGATPIAETEFPTTREADSRGWVDVSAGSWNGRAVHRLIQTACDAADAWNHTPLIPTPGAEPP